MARIRLLYMLGAASLVAFSACGTSGGGEGTGKLRTEAVGPALRSLPFRTHVGAVKAPQGDDAAFIGIAERAGVKVRFSIGIGDSPVPVPIPGIGADRALGEGGFGFSFTTDAFYPGNFKSKSEYDKAVRTAVQVSEQLCRKVSGEPCPV